MPWSKASQALFVLALTDLVLVCLKVVSPVNLAIWLLYVTKLTHLLTFVPVPCLCLEIRLLCLGLDIDKSPVCRLDIASCVSL